MTFKTTDVGALFRFPESTQMSLDVGSSPLMTFQISSSCPGLEKQSVYPGHSGIGQ